MKVFANANFPIAIRDERFEHEPAVASLYEGIFSVHCNHVVEVRFVPAFRTASNWPPTKTFADSFDWDAPPDALVARWSVAMSSDIVVVPGDSAELAVVETPLDSALVHLVVVPFARFEELVRELHALLDDRPLIAWRAFGGGGIPVAELESLWLVRFLRDHVLRPPILDAEGLRMLGLEPPPA